MMNTNHIGTERLKKNHGFTLIEIIAVLIIMAIVSAVVLVRGTSTDYANLQAEVDTLKGHLRFAQCLAMNDIPPTKWGIQISGQSYTLIKDPYGTGIVGNFESPFSLPGESSEKHTSTITGAAGMGTILFDEWGSPSATSATFVGQSITITANTGFIL